MTFLKGDVITGIAVTLVGAVYYIATFWIQETSNIVTPRTFPAIVGVALIVLGLFLAGQAVYRSRKLAEAGDGSAGSVAGVRDGSAGGVAGVRDGSAGSVAGVRDGGTAPARGEDDGADARNGGAASVSGDDDSGTASADAASKGASGVVLEAPQAAPSKKVVLQFALFFVYLAILIPVGFLLSTAAFLMAMTSIYARHRWVRNLIFSVLFAIVIYVAFVYGLAVYLPVGILG